MVPQKGRPSPHLIINDIWFPSKEELLIGIEPGFGATIAVRAIETECGRNSKVGGIRTTSYNRLLGLFQFP